MTAGKAKNVIELRRLLAEKFPGVRMAAGAPDNLVKRWPTQIAPLDAQLQGGLAKSALTEFISSGSGCGSSLLLAALIRQAHHNGEWTALIDGADAFDPASLTNEELSRLLWVRCGSAAEAMKATDLVLHDGTIPLVAVDLTSCARKELRRIPSSTWHRLVRTVEHAATVCAIFTPEAMVSTAETRLELQARFDLDALETERETLLAQIVARSISDRERMQERRFGAAG